MRVLIRYNYPFLRRTHLLFATVLMLIVGVISMHSASDGNSGHHGAALNLSSFHDSGAVTTTEQSNTISEQNLAPRCGISCTFATTLGPVHVDTLVKCMLALLAGLLLLFRPALFRHTRNVTQRWIPLNFARQARILPHLQPSLQKLAICRT